MDDSVVWDDPARVRGELLTEAQLLCHATELARSYSSPTLRGSARPLRKRFRETRRLIQRAYATLLDGAKRKREPSPAELWLLDNSHVVEGQLREIDDDLPWGYLVELPRMSRGAMRGFPLVYGLCLDYLRHTDCHVDFDSLSRFVDAYQSERVLTIGELWAVPIMLRLGLVIAVGVLATNEAQSSDRDLAEHWASRILGPPLARASELRRPREELQATLLELEEFGAAAPPSDAFLVTLLKRLREREDTPSEALDWIALQTARLHTTPEELARRHHLRQAANQVSVGNAINSMRAINSLDWRVFFQRTSRVEAILLQDPGDVYARMDDGSRDRCRHAIEKLARKSGRSEVEVASATLALAAQHRNESEDYRAHVGYYLLDDGQTELHAALRYAPGSFARFAALPAKHPASVYLGSVSCLSLALLALSFTLLSNAGTPTWLNALLLLPLLVAASEAALALVNAAVVALVPPRILAKFEFEAGIPSSYETLVVVPTLLASPAGVDRLIEELEVRGLANTDKHLYFALLSDFVDADAAERPGERELVERARLGIERLNTRHVEARYFLLHRRRAFDPHEGRYMGWERKRGKLAELNRLLRGAPDTSFEVVTAPAELLARIRYVITLDTDTELPLGVARRLVATIAHPLNRPWVDARAQRVRRGHAIIQPRVGTSPTSARKSLFARLAAGPPGIDPYTTAVSDVYQDLFGEGSFVGKGIYDVDAFEAVMAGRVPDNQLLSHDLFESIYARAALASDIEVLDEQPAAYAIAAGRQHRWIRGDWQLLPWLFPRVPGRHATRRYDFRAFDAWRVLDNLRRSLLAPALVVLAVTTWFSGEASAAFGSLVVLAVYTVPVGGRFVFALARPSRELDWLGGLGGDLRGNAQQAMLSLVFVLDQAILHLDAVVRALYRQYVTRKHMLEWATMRDSAAHTKDSLRQAPRLLVGSALASLLLLSLLWVEPEALPFAAPLLGLWLGAPWVARWVSRVRPEVVAEPWGPEEALVFRRIARKTWRFFERFVGDLDQHLPPDNYQEDPRGVVAHRTSPTNIGLYLLAVAAARDLGFISLAEAVRRWRATLQTIGRLEKREGHLLNWYDTTTLAPLEPRYVSTVDSGNLAGYLWTLAETCRDMRDAPLLSEATLVAALDAAYLARAAVTTGSQSDAERRRVDALITELERAEAERKLFPHGLPSILLGLTASLAASKQGEPEHERGEASDFAYWYDTAVRSLHCARTSLDEELPHLVWLARRVNWQAHAETRREEDSASSELALTLTRAVSPHALVELVDTGLEPVLSLAAKLYGVDSRNDLERSLYAARTNAQARLDTLGALAGEAERLVRDMNFSFLYDDQRALFSIGFSVSGSRLDNSHYDLLASEARLASLVAIAKGDVPEEHWLRLGRLRAKYASAPGLLSWSGSMFEYLMPLLVTRSYPDTLLDQTCHAVVERQIAHAAGFGVPWGVSEAAYNVMDLGMNYQYRAFGVPGTGLKSGLGEDLVVAPYATALAALVRARAAAKNFAALERAGLDGTYGFYESVDYTPSRLPPGREKVVVKAFMAHHQGMTIVALSNLLSDFAMQRRFHADARVKACALLLEERIPVHAGVVHPETPRMAPNLAAALEPEGSEFLDWNNARTGPPRGHLLGQGGVSAWVTCGGEGFLAWRGIEVQRYREDASLECGGTYLYFRHLGANHYWSSGYQPTRAEPTHYDVVFSLDKVELGRRDGDIETLTEITLSPEHPAEIRRVTLTNHGRKRASLDVTTFTELCLLQRSADIAHPAFQKLFVETEFLPERGALVAHRRKRSENDPDIWVAQFLVGAEVRVVKHGTSRAAFLGRNGSVRAPAGLCDESPWAGTSTGLLDPALILRCSVELKPGAQTRFSLVTVLAESRAAVLDLVELFAAAHSVPRAFELAWADARVELRHLGISAAKAHRYQRLLSALLFPHPALRGSSNPPAGTRGREALWSQGISGDLPIVVLRLDDQEFTELCRDLLLAHEYWRLNGVLTDLVILNEEAAGYLQPVQEAVFSLIRSTPAEGHTDQRGGVFVRRAALIALEDVQLITCAARLVLYASRGSLGRQLRPLSTRGSKKRPNASGKGPDSIPPVPALLALPNPPRRAVCLPPGLAFANGVGGFDPGSGEYVMALGPGNRTPAPFSNVIAGPRFGTLVTESGASFSWFENSQKHRLTPWSNDPTLDPSGELLYVHDVESDATWTLTPCPGGGEATYVVRHGQGYSVFEHERDGLVQRLEVAVDPSAPVKLWRVSLENRSTRTRRLRVIGYVEWVLGNHRETSRVATVADYHPELHAILARNPFSAFPKSRAFFCTTGEVHSAVADRGEFFGRFASRERPGGLGVPRLSGSFGPGLDPCAALAVEVVIEAGANVELAFLLGAGEDEREAFELARRFQSGDEASAVGTRARAFWQDLLGRVRVSTPDPAFDLLMNHWLPYQALSCRFWGRSGFYQSGGAYGFRDQLQDSLALVHARPDLTRQHLLLSASRQFVEGDVQHWWHLDTGEGVRTQCSDDLLWLPWAALEYVRSTGDHKVWDERVGFLQERLLEPGQDDLYSVPPAAAESASLYDHCVRALEAAATRGPHGLPLMRAGDWNDGMNRVGREGIGESVWLAWFASHVLEGFAEVAEQRGDRERAHTCRSERKRLGNALEAHAWDGGWYRRGTFDDQSPLGSAASEECRIDAIAQSWAVISRAGRADRATRALDASLAHLWRREAKLMLLLTPPFSGMGNDPGYIAAYPPGIRENGGQYTHGVLWTVLALLLERRGDEAYQLLQDLNPIRHTADRAGLETYRVEPYVVAADVYSHASLTGRGGWTWYTGSASWMYRIGLEWLLGIQRRGNELWIDPELPRDFAPCEVRYRSEVGGELIITIEKPDAALDGEFILELDGKRLDSRCVSLPGRGEQQRLRLRAGTRALSHRRSVGA